MGCEASVAEWDGAKWGGVDIPDYSAAAPGSDVSPFIMQPEGWAVCSLLIKWRKGRSRNYEPFETPLGTNPLHQTWSLTQPLASSKAISSRWAKRTNSRTSAPLTA